jgi:hypothetical protein
MEQGSEKYEPIIIDNEVSEKALSNSYNLKRSLYGISREEFDGLVKAQNSACASCEDDATGSEHSLQVDHCHDTLEIRGLLCNGCNTAASWLEDDPEKAEKLAEYLRSNGTGLFTSFKSRSIHD